MTTFRRALPLNRGVFRWSRQLSLRSHAIDTLCVPVQEGAHVAGGLATRLPSAKAVYEVLQAPLARSSAGLGRFLADS